MIKNKLLLCFLYTFTLLINAEYSAVPGELIAIKLKKSTENIISNELVVENDLNKIIIIPIPYNNTNLSLNLYDIQINIQKKDFGESRITIDNLSQVDLNNEDAARAYKESRIIKDAVKTYSNYINFYKPISNSICCSIISISRYIDRVYWKKLKKFI